MSKPTATATALPITRVAWESASASHVEWHVANVIFKSRWAAKLYAATPTAQMLDDLGWDKQVVGIKA